MSDLEEFLKDRPAIRSFELARALGVSRAYISQLIDRGEIKANRVGRIVLIPRSEVLRVFGGSDEIAA